MDAARSVVPQTGVEAEDKQQGLIWDPTADAKQISPSQHKMSVGSHAERLNLPERPGRRWSTEPSWPSCGPSPWADPKRPGTPAGAGEGEYMHVHQSTTRGRNTQAAVGVPEC